MSCKGSLNGNATTLGTGVLGPRLAESIQTSRSRARDPRPKRASPRQHDKKLAGKIFSPPSFGTKCTPTRVSHPCGRSMRPWSQARIVAVDLISSSSIDHTLKVFSEMLTHRTRHQHANKATDSPNTGWRVPFLCPKGDGASDVETVTVQCQCLGVGAEVQVRRSDHRGTYGVTVWIARLVWIGFCGLVWFGLELVWGRFEIDF